MDATFQDDESVVGDECYVISGKPNGPRYDPEFPVDKVVSFSNLILFCRVHHKMIDDQPETFTTEKLRQLKVSHEKWVADVLESATSLEDLLLTRLSEAIFQKVKALKYDSFLQAKRTHISAGIKYVYRRVAEKHEVVGKCPECSKSKKI